MTNATVFMHVQQLQLQLPDGFTLGPVNFMLQSGKVYGLLGANGAGKSTLLQLLAGLKQPHQGQVLLQQQSLHKLQPRLRARQVAYMSQQQVPADITVRQLLQLGLLPHKNLWQHDSVADNEAIDLALIRVGLQHKATAMLAQLSGGEQQRAHLARVLVQRAAVLLLDEPVNHLDIHYQHQLLADLRQTGLTVLASFHDINLAAGYCDELLVLQQGQLLANGPPELVLTPTLLQSVFGRPCLVDQSPFAGHCRVTFAPELR